MRPGPVVLNDTVRVEWRPSSYPSKHRGLTVDAVGHAPAHDVDSIRRPKQVDRHVQAVDAQVEHRTAPECRVEEAIVRVEGSPGREVALHAAHLAEHAIVDEAAQGGVGGQESGPHCLHDKRAASASGVHHALGVGQRRGEGLFDQQSLARLDGSEGQVGVEGVGGGQVDRIDVGRGEQLLKGEGSHPDAVGQVLPGAARTPRHRDQLGRG